MNQVTVVEVVDPTDRFSITGVGYGLDGEVHHAAGNTNTIEAAIVPFLVTNDAKLVNGKVVGDPTEGALLVLGHKAKIDTEATRDAYPRLATLPFDPTYKLMATFSMRKDGTLATPSCACSSRARPRQSSAGRRRRWRRAPTSTGTTTWRPGPASRWIDWEEEGLRVMAAATDIADFDPDGDLLSMVQDLQVTAIVGA